MSENHLTLEEAKKKFGEDNIREIFQIQIGNEIHNVYSIEGYEHQLGKDNGCPDQWWLDYPGQQGLVPYIDKGVHRVCWGVEYQQFNSTKPKWDEYRISNGGICTITANGKEVYKFHHRELSGALATAQVKIEKMSYHPFDFVNPQKEIGRNIWYYGLPAKILLGYDAGEIRIEPDYSYIDSEEWWDLLHQRKSNIQPKNTEMNHFQQQMEEMSNDSFQESKDYGIINHGDALYDKMIDWFRD